MIYVVILVNSRLNVILVNSLLKVILVDGLLLVILFINSILLIESFNDWGGGFDDSIPRMSTEQFLQGTGIHDPLHGRQALSCRIELLSQEGWSNIFPVGAIFVPSPTTTGKYFRHLPPPSVKRLNCDLY